MKRLVLSILVVASLVVPAIASAHRIRISPLSMTTARSEAAYSATYFISPTGGVHSIYSTWCNRLSRWNVNCGVGATVQVHILGLGYELVSCSAVVNVYKSSRTGHIYASPHNRRC